MSWCAAPWIGSAPPGSRAATHPLADYFGHEGTLAGHFNERGNRAAFAGIRAGLASSAAIEVAGPGISAAEVDQIVTRGQRGSARYEYGDRPPFDDPADLARLCFRVGADGPTELSYDLAARAHSFSATVRLIPLARISPDVGSVGLTLLADGEPILERTIQRSDPKREIQINLAGVKRLTIRADNAGDGLQGDWLVLAEPRFE